MPADARRLKGTVKWFNDVKGYGFITRADGGEVFLHITNWLHETDPRQGDKVTFVEGKGRDGRPLASQIMVG
jgi:cold shock protein